jgi:uncharacterized protein (DUF433 family)
MKTEFQTKPLIGRGIYTIPDMAAILDIRYQKVSRWISTFWNDRFGSQYGHQYSWYVDLTKAVNFHTMIELFIFYQLNNAGVTTREIIKAHQILADQYKTNYPFATKSIVDCIRTDGKRILFEQKDGSIYSVDIAKQFKLNFIKDFFKNLEFGSDSIATRLWPLGKDRSILCDPKFQFGQPIIAGKNILVDVIYEMVLAGDSIDFVADIYDLTRKQVEDALEYAKRAA